MQREKEKRFLLQTEFIRDQTKPAGRCGGLGSVTSVRMRRVFFWAEGSKDALGNVLNVTLNTSVVLTGS